MYNNQFDQIQYINEIYDKFFVSPATLTRWFRKYIHLSPKEFLESNRSEAIKVSIYEYNEQEHMRMEREDAFEDGRKIGQEETLNLMFELMNKMTTDGLGNQLSRLSSDPDFYQEMVKKDLDT